MSCFIPDNSTETFWESGDEDRNKPKTITITCQGKANPRIVYVHIDNTRDIGVSEVEISCDVLCMVYVHDLHCPQILVVRCHVWGWEVASSNSGPGTDGTGSSLYCCLHI